MGCVIGKRAAGEGGRNPGDNEKQGEVGSAAVTVPAEIRNNEKIEEVSSAPPEFHLKRGVSFNDGGWPSWLKDVAGDAIKHWKPRRANTFEKLDKIGQGTYSNVYKVRDLTNGKIMALKKVRFDNLEPETVRFMAREILVLTKLNHPNVIKLEGLVISRMSSSLYLIFEYMEHDLAGLAALQSDKLTEPQVKCYMKQLLAGLEHCHNNGVLHRDIKCSNLLIDNDGNLKIADFGLATYFDSQRKRPMTSRVVTLWYRPPELLLGATYYDTGVDLWSAGCILAELLAGKPILRGRTEVEQLHKIFKLCGSPSEEFWKKSKLPNATVYKPQQPYKCCLSETYKDFPPSALSLMGNLLAVDPDARGSATAALNSDFFTSEPAPCEPSDLPKFPPSKEMDIKLRDEETRKQQGGVLKPQAVDPNRRERTRKFTSRAMPAPEANAELQVNLDRMRFMSDTRNRSKSEKFPPPHEDGAVGHPLDPSQNNVPSFSTASPSFSSFIFDPKSSLSLRRSSYKNGASRSRNRRDDDPPKDPTRSTVTGFYSSVSWDWLKRRGASQKFR